MNLDSKWLDLLKMSGWQTGAVAVGCGVFYYLTTAGVLPPVAPPWSSIAPAVGLICFSLSISSLLSSIVSTVRDGPVFAFKQRLATRQAQSEVRKELHFLQPHEAQIIAFLLAYQRKRFTARLGDELLSGLIARGWVHVTGQAGQAISILSVPHRVPDHVWDVLVEQHDLFQGVPHIDPANSSRW